MNSTIHSPEPGRPAPRSVLSRIGRFRYSAVELLGALALLFFITPFIEDLPQGSSIEVVALTLVMVSAVLAVGGRRRTLVIALLLVTPALAAKWINHLCPDLISPVFFLILVMVFFAFVVASLIRFILRAPHVDTNVLCAGLSGYLMLGMLWIPAYLLVARLSPGSFLLSAGPEAGRPMGGFNAFYFSYTTLCTVGYGDVIPISKVARMLAVAEAVTGLFYMTVLVSRLVAVYSSSAYETKAKENERLS